MNSVNGVDVQVPFDFDINAWSSSRVCSIWMVVRLLRSFVLATRSLTATTSVFVTSVRFLRGLYSTMKSKGALENVALSSLLLSLLLVICVLTLAWTRRRLPRLRLRC